MKLNPSELTILTSRLIAVSQRLEHNPNREKEGGILTVGLDGFAQKYCLEVRTFPWKKRDRYTRLSQEKAYRAYAHCLRRPGVAVSSWQTRDDKDERWGGAVLFPPLGALANVISFSGLAEVTDEAVALTLGYKLGLVTDPQYAVRVTQISGNPVFEELFQEFDRTDFPKL